MADRRSLFSRLWPAPASRRSPPSVTDSPPTSQTNPTSAAPARRPATVAGGSSPSQPTRNQQTNDQPSATSSQPRKAPTSQEQTATQPTATSPTNPTNEPKTRSPSHATTQSGYSSKPASPNRRVTQSKSPPQPSSVPKRATNPRSPSRVTSRSPNQGSTSSSKRTQPTSPPKESRQPTQGISNSHEKRTKPAASRQEPPTKAEVRSDSSNDLNGQKLDGTNKHDEMEPIPSQSSEAGAEKPGPSNGLDSSTTKGDEKPLVELNTKPEETKDVREVVQAMNTEGREETKKEVNDSLPSNSGFEPQIIEKEASEETKKEVDDSLSPKSGSITQVEKPEIPSKPDQMLGEKQEAVHTKEILATSLPYATISQPKKRSITSETHNKPAVPNEEHVPLHKNIRDDMSTFVNKVAIHDPKGAVYDTPLSVITIAGDNRGASMQIEPNSSRKEGPVYIHRSYKINHEETGEATTDGEGSSDQKKSEDENTTDDQPTEAYVNNNSQGINNSIVFNSSVTEGNPGVHMIVNHLAKDQIQSTDKGSLPEARKAEFNMSRTEKLTYQPTVRRRCLRGLFLETSDSDLDNPEKPRRHGCRIGCQKSEKENNIDVL